MMTSRDEGSSSRVVSGNVYVAVGSDVAEGGMTLLWALQNFGKESNYCILHVRQPGELLERQNTNKNLDAYIRMCDQEKVSSMKLYAEMQDIGQKIVELVERHCIRKLVMGAAANSHYIEGMAQLKSTKAMFVNQHAHPSCEIWFICRDNLVYWRESRSMSSHVQSGQSTPRSDNFGSDSSEVAGNLALVQFEGPERSNGSSETNLVPSVHQPPSSAAEGINSEELCEQLDRAMSEVTKAKREALEELIRRQNAEKAAIEAKRMLTQVGREAVYMHENLGVLPSAVDGEDTAYSF
ncbi:hypothetical protein BT93_H2345 [Corymbia citriodora subsp. variegata]|nr:hypothetical protein BT93_H2345 [Corymbia citriodora subsp. variegata]